MCLPFTVKSATRYFERGTQGLLSRLSLLCVGSTHVCSGTISHGLPMGWSCDLSCIHDWWRRGALHWLATFCERTPVLLSTLGDATPTAQVIGLSDGWWVRHYCERFLLVSLSWKRREWGISTLYWLLGLLIRVDFVSTHKRDVHLCEFSHIFIMHRGAYLILKLVWLGQIGTSW